MGLMGRCACAWVLVLFGPGSALAEPELPRAQAAKLASVARQLAGKGFLKQARELQQLLVEWDAPETLRANLARTVARALQKQESGKKTKSRKPPGTHPAAARALIRVARDLVRGATKAGGLTPEGAARVLVLDSENEAARKVLGHVQQEGRWLRPFMPALLKRRAETRDALRRARRIEVKLERGTSKSPYFKALYGRAGIVVSWKGLVHVHAADVSETKLRRILATTLRASAVSHWLRTGKLVVPEPNARVTFYCNGTTPVYTRWIERARANGDISAEDAAFGRKLSGFWLKSSHFVFRPSPEAEWEAYMLDDVLGSQIARRHRLTPQPALFAGHLHWLCLSFLGVGMPSMMYTEVNVTKKKGPGRTQSAPVETILREELQKLAQAGMHGLRGWMAFLAQRREDPPWKNSFVDQIGRITGDDLLKTTTVVEYLQEARRFTTIMEKSEKVYGDLDSRAEGFEEALGMPLKRFEERWRAWIVPPRTGLAQRLGAVTGKRSAGPASLARYLDELRRSTMPANVAGELHTLRFDPELSAGCRAHALYLQANPAQQQAWPDAHEEWPDKARFSAAGSWAGLHSVIAFQIKRPEDSIDGWMGTFYHRLPLLDPGLMRIGWGLQNGIAVLDAASMSAPVRYQIAMVWPAPGQSKVPLSFQPELPSPVPGEDQSHWGYPITVQCFGESPGFDPRLRLLQGGTEVPCHYSTPDKPTNPELAPADTWCLIPKQRLKAGTEYEVRCKHPVYGEAYRWKFKTK